MPLPAKICAETIAALHFLHPIPSEPFSNPVTSIQCRKDDYTLSFEKERSLCSTLAFLAYAKDDNNNIPAVCLEEGTGAAYLNVLLAINKFGHDGGNQALERLKAEFESIFSLLAHADGTTLAVENDVFRAIVSMCSARILYRLSLIRSHKRRQKRSIKEGLQVTLEYLKQNVIRKHEPSSPLYSFIDRAKDVLRLIDSWDKHQTQPELEELVDGIRHLRQVKSFYAFINSIPDRDMESDSKARLINTISKVARYREAARSLYRAAKKIPLVRNMHLVIIQLPQKVFDKDLGSDYTSNLGDSLPVIGKLKKKKYLEQVCDLLNTTKEQANNRFIEQTRKTLQEARIHAEIQLLYYCEFYMSPNAHMPRVVCSSKDACWLCNEFILTYEKIHTPKCHGKIYPGWRLPASCGPECHDLATRYNIRLQGHVRNGLETLFARREKTVYTGPNESTLLTLPWSSSTLPTMTSSPLDALETSSTINKDQQKIELPSERASTHESILVDDEGSKKIPVEMEEIVHEDSSHFSRGSSSIPESLDKISTPMASSPSESNLTLELGKVRSKQVEIGKTSSLYKAGPLEVQIEYAENSNPESRCGSQKKLSYAVEWLTFEEAERLRNGRDDLIIDAGLLEGEIEHNTDGDGCVYISNGDAVVKIFMRPVAME
ncbi:hypothetical protein F5Y00DRAFT_272648 [Daldinia vernicosa]|uniref:uncharacterized protein n=1 Tax=Daldinia vernicosa TaxID=114800 RepID=UPI00200866D4|nr:uncharacterized protein F5Y00DRAFT_272648 [Daldinia vernicosa]KAI0845841.1 hypothetical protein F5Y00DRAFT_272648 [Daldinia vernicosa]